MEASRGTPNHGVSEEATLKRFQQLDKLVASHNEVVDTLDRFKQLGVADRALESHYMLSTILELCAEKGLFTAEDIQRVAARVQMRDMGMKPKPEGTVAEMGDRLVIKFQILDGDKVVEDQSQAPCEYELGSQGLGCDEALVGMKVGEQRSVPGKVRQGFHLPELVGKDLTMVVLLVSIMVPLAKEPG